MTKPEKPEVRSVPASEARQQLPQLLNTVHQGKTRIVVERSGIPIAAIVTIAELRQLEALDRDREELWAGMERMSDAFKDVPPEELEREVDRAVTQVRAEMRAEREAQRRSTPST